MKIEKTGKTQSSVGAGNKHSASKSDGSFGNMIGNKTASVGGTSISGNIAGIDSLLAVQSVDNPADRPAKRRMALRSQKILDGLDRIRKAMLTGQLNIGDMINLADMVAQHREKIGDPDMVAILDEIDLRANVEIAKFLSAR